MNEIGTLHYKMVGLDLKVAPSPLRSDHSKKTIFLGAKSIVDFSDSRKGEEYYQSSYSYDARLTIAFLTHNKQANDRISAEW